MRLLPPHPSDARLVFLWVILFQGFHESEHIVQIIQRFTLNIPNGNGIVGQAVDVEPLHFLYNGGLLLFLGILWWAADLRHRRGREWGTLAFALIVFSTAAQCWHMVEHVFKILQYLPNHVNGTPGLLGVYFNIPWLHFFYNTLVYLPLLVAFFAAGVPSSLLGAERMRRFALDAVLALVLAMAGHTLAAPLYYLVLGWPEPLGTLLSVIMALGFSFGPAVVRAVLPPETVASYTPSPIPTIPAVAVDVLLLAIPAYALVQVARSVGLWRSVGERLRPGKLMSSSASATGSARSGHSVPRGRV